MFGLKRVRVGVGVSGEAISMNLAFGPRGRLGRSGGVFESGGGGSV